LSLWQVMQYLPINARRASATDVPDEVGCCAGAA
jgi:hypothetical protein